MRGTHDKKKNLTRSFVILYNFNRVPRKPTSWPRLLKCNYRRNARLARSRETFDRVAVYKYVGRGCVRDDNRDL